MITYIDLSFIAFPNFKINERAENIKVWESNVFNEKFTRFEIANIYDPRVRFAFNIQVDKRWKSSRVHTIYYIFKQQ